MLVTMRWDGCEFRDGEWGAAPHTAFWVGVAPEELPDLLAELTEPDDLIAGLAELEHDGDDRRWLLVSSDASSATALPSYYPHSGQWNGRSPFTEITPTEIQSLGELVDLV